MEKKDKSFFQELLHKLDLLDQVDQNDPEFVRYLKEVILKQKSLMGEFFQTIHGSPPSGMEHALVLRSKPVSVTGYKDQQYGDFKLQSKVCIHPESPFLGRPDYPDESGEVIQFDPEGFTGWALVQFASGKRKSLRYGNPEVDNGACDLILLEKPLIEQIKEHITSVVYRGGVVDVFNYLAIKLEPGDTVLIHPETGVIVGKTEPLDSGKVAYIEEIIGTEAVVSVAGVKYAVMLPQGVTASRGDRAVVDEGVHIILRVLPKTESIAITSGIDPVEADDIIGLEDAKEDALEVIDFISHPEIYKAYGAEETKGILLVGPPGNGKTHFGRWVATVISRVMGIKDGKIEGFFYIKATEILDMFVGEGPRKVRDVFQKAIEYFERTGRKPIIFVDEIEAVTKRRGNKNDGGSADDITNAFLTEMDGVLQSCAFIIGATNRPDLMDEAALRAGRFDRIIPVNRPTDKDVPLFFELFLKKTVVDKNFTREGLVKFATEEYLSDRYAFHELYYAKEGVDPNAPDIPKDKRFDLKYFKLAHVGSGAMLETIINRAKLKAAKRDLEAKRGPTGVTEEDIRIAINEAYETNKLINHESAVAEFVKQQSVEPVEIVSRI